MVPGDKKKKSNPGFMHAKQELLTELYPQLCFRNSQQKSLKLLSTDLELFLCVDIVSVCVCVRTSAPVHTGYIHPSITWSLPYFQCQAIGAWHHAWILGGCGESKLWSSCLRSRPN